jgi:hypothetical protein
MTGDPIHRRLCAKVEIQTKLNSKDLFSMIRHRLERKGEPLMALLEEAMRCIPWKHK